MNGGEMIVKQLKAVFGDRVYPDVIPEKNEIWPVAVYQIISSAPENTQDGNFTGIEECRYQLDIYGLSRSNVREAVARALPLLTDPARQPNLVCLYRGRRELYDSEVRRFRAAVDLSIWETM